MGNKHTSKESFAFQVENTGIEGVETPHYRNIVCLTENEGELIENIWDITTCHELFMRAVNKYGRFPCLGKRSIDENGQRGEFEWITYDKVHKTMKSLGSGLKSIGIEEGDKVGIMCDNRPEWVYSLQACYAYSFIFVPLYNTLGVNNLVYILGQSNLNVFITTSDHIQKLYNREKEFPTLKWIICLDENPDHDLKGINIISFEELIKIGEDITCDFTPPSASDLATICFSSGSTGDPKGVMLTHRNLVASISGVLSMGIPIYSTDVYLSYLPLAHSYERILVEVMLARGGAIGFYSGDIMKLLEDVSELQPTIFTSVPRVYNKLYDIIKYGIEVNGGIYQNMFDTALSHKQNGLKSKKNTNSLFWDAIVFNKFKIKFGGRIRFMVSGSAPLSPEVHDFFQLVLSCPLVQGYGLTETSSVVSCQNFDNNISGKVGPPLPCCEIKLVSCSDLGYLVSSDPPQGEICVRGPNVFSGYYNQHEEYRKVVDEDGWFHTGDIGEITSDGSLIIIDRINSIFKLSQGEFVSVSKIENIMTTHNKYIDQIFVYGDSTRSKLVAIVVIKLENVIEWIKKEAPSHSTEINDIYNNLKVKTMLLNEIIRTSKEHELSSFEYIANIYLEREPFTKENHLLSENNKLRRNQLALKYGDIIENMYCEDTQ